ncbi:MAG: PilZ domain-containing protein [Myxococcota bacterium]
MDNRRVATRTPCRLAAQIAAGERTLDVAFRDLSLGGAFVEALERVPVGERVTVRFRVPAQPDPIEVGGEVRWHGREEAGAPGFGVRFDGLRARDAWALTRFLDAAA